MRRFAYVPKVEAYIRLDTPKTANNPFGGSIIDITDDIVNGSVTRRLNAMSSAQLTLQNRKGKYTMEASRINADAQVRFTPMDRIIIRMARVGPSFDIFAGYLDETPYFQLYPGTVQISASCPLKLLANTYFDPGVPFMIDWFAKQGFYWDAASGTLTDYPGAAATDSSHAPIGRFGSLDYLGGMASVVRQALIDIGNWPEDAINIVSLPDGFLDVMAKELQKSDAEDEDRIQFVKDRLKTLFEVQNVGAALGASDGAVTGNVAPEKIAQYAKAAGLSSTNALVEAVAHSLAESSGNSGAVLYDSNGTYDIGLWQINTVHTSGGGSGLPAPPTMNYAGVMKVINQMPTGVQTYIKNLFSPTFNAAQMVSVSNHGTNFGNSSIWVAQPSTSDYERAKTAVASLGSTTNTSAATDTSASATGGGTAASVSLATKIVQIAIGEANKHIVEIGGDDKGAEIKKYQDYVGISQGQDWCAGFVSWVFGQAGVAKVKSPSVSAFPSYGTTVTDPQPADIIVWGSDHVGIVVSSSGGTVDTVQGNTSGPGSLTGGVFRKPAQPGGTYIRVADLGAAAVGDLAGTMGVDARDVAAIAQQVGWFQAQFQGTDPAASILLEGKRALANDVSLLEWLQAGLTGTGRVFTTRPDGSFLAFFPDYFGYFGNTPYFSIEDIEIIDLTINRNDRELTTHLFTAGSQFGAPGSISQAFELAVSKVASVEDPAFKVFINVDVDDPVTPQKEGDFNYAEFLQRYGARPLQYPMPDIRHPFILWTAGWMEFSRRWALQFDAHAEITFMPELLPGGLVELGGRITMFVNEVTHSFDRSSGFTTQAHLIAPAAKDRKHFVDLPKNGLNTSSTSTNTIGKK